MTLRDTLVALNIFARLTALEQFKATTMSALDDLQAADAKLGTSVAAAVSKLNDDTTQLATLAAQVAAGQGDATALSSLAADISAKADALNAAVNPAPAAPAAPAAAPAAATGTDTVASGTQA